MVSEALFMSASSTSAFIDVIQETGREVQMDLDRARISAATGGSADVHVQMDHLIQFYNALSDMHEELYVFKNEVLAQAAALRGTDAGGKVAGIATAWTEITAGIGARGAAASLAAHLQAVDNEVLRYMDILNKNATDYAEHENIAITKLDKAAGTAKHHAKKHGDKAGNKHQHKSGKGGQVKAGAVLQGGSEQVLQGSEQVLQAPSDDAAPHGGLVLGG